MATTLTGVGFVWAFLSLAAAIMCCSGFYLPFWIQNKSSGEKLIKKKPVINKGQENNVRSLHARAERGRAHG
ncbi:hypothetical protein J6590_049288 [Homalodisca vitripennis]|nr:hypothetical protein J6590_049288 [Homalodisca vitripennis]